MAKYKIADLVVEMNTFGRTEQQAKAYLTDPDAPADIVLPPSDTDLKWFNSELSEDDCEYLSTGIFFYRNLFLHHGVLLHSSCVVVDGKAYLFTAPCGTGKSTHTRLWLKLFGDRAYILNDDKPAIRVIKNKIYVYGTPWSGKDDSQRNERVELGGIAVIRRDEVNSIRLLDQETAIFELMNQTTRSHQARSLLSCMEIIGCIAAHSNVYELKCNMDLSAAILSYETMSGKRFIYED